MNLLKLILLFSLKLSTAYIFNVPMLEIMGTEAYKSNLGHMLKSIFYSLKYEHFSNIDDTNGADPFKERMSLTNIKVSNVNFASINKFADLTVENDSICLHTHEINLVYNLIFDWRVEMGKVHVKFGNGLAKIDCSKFSASHKPKTHESSLNIECESEIDYISDMGILLGGFKKWVEEKIDKKTKMEAIGYLKKKESIIGKYMHSILDEIEKTIDNNLLVYRSSVKNITLVDGSKTENRWLIYERDIEIYLNGRPITKVKGLLHNNTKEDYSVYLATSSGIIPSTIKVFAGLGKLNGEYDMTKENYTGTVKDIYEIVPELRSQYMGSEPLKVNYKCLYESIDYNTESSIMVIPVEFSFNVDTEKEVLNAKISFAMNYRIDEEKAKIGKFVDILSNVKPVQVVSEPTSLKTTTFLMDFAFSFGKKTYEGRSFNVPKLTYIPWLAQQEPILSSNDGKDFCQIFRY